MKALLHALVFLAFATLLAAAPWPPPGPVTGEAGEHLLRLAGYPELEPLLRRWQEGFARTHPGVRFELHLTGSDTGMARLYTAQADLTLLGREATANEVKAFEWIYHDRPLGVEILTGSLDRAGRSPALAVLVHPSNPLAQLTLAQLDALFSPERRRGAPSDLRTWGQLGLTGGWADRPIHLYCCDTESNTGCYFRQVALRDSRHLHWDRLQEFADTRRTGTPVHDAAAKIRAALAADPAGLAVASLPPGTDTGVKALDLALGASGEAVPANTDTVRTRRYPFARPVFAYLNQPKAAPARPLVVEFLRYILSPEGQGAIEPADGYLSLTPNLSQAQAAKLH